MPFAKPLPEWNAVGVEPPQSLKDEGWKPIQKPPADYFNWYMFNTYQALLELQQKAALKDEIPLPPDASTTQKGLTKLNDTTNSTSTTEAATANAVKKVNDALVTHSADYKTHTGYAVVTGTANNYVAALTPALSAYAEGVSFRLKINVDNTGASTVNVNGLGVKSIKKSNGSDVNAGQLKAGSVHTLVYNGTDFILQGEGSDLSDADISSLISTINNIYNM